MHRVRRQVAVRAQGSQNPRLTPHQRDADTTCRLLREDPCLLKAVYQTRDQLQGPAREG